MKQKLLKTMLLLCALIVGSGTMWGAEGDEITSIANIVDGKSYYIKGVRNVSGNPTTFYLNFTDAIGSQSGTESSTTAGAQLITFHKQSDGVYHLETALGNFIAPGTSNGKIQVAAAGINVTASNQSSIIRLSITSGSNTWSIQKNTSATNFGGYKNTQTDITLIEGPAAVKTDPTITFSNGSVRVGRTLDLSTLFSSNSEGAVTYSITAGGDYASLEGSTLTGVAEGSVTVKAAQATAGNYNAGEASATITVNPALTLSSIAITTPPTKTTYTEGDTFDPTGMVVTATYSDASTADVTASCTFSPSTSTALTASNTEITVSYTENAVEKTATQAITVNALSYAIKLAAGTADASNWTITPTPATAGQTITISYTGTRTITSVKAVKKPFGLSTFSFATPELGKSSNLTFTGASTEKPVWFTGKCDTHNTTGTVTYSHIAAGSYDELYFDGQLISRTGYPYPFTLYITDGLGTKADPFVLSFDEGSSDMALTMTSTGEKTWTITLPTSDVEIQVLMPYTVTFGDDNSTLTEASGGAGVTLPSRPNIGSYTFAGWSETNVTTETTEEPVIIEEGEYYPAADITLYPVYTRKEGSVLDVVDVLNLALTGVENGSTSYTNWTDKTATSPAVYAGQSAGGNDAIQLRSDNSNSGIVTTTSGGKVKKVSISWNSNTNSARKVDVYGKNSAYSAASDLYNESTQGTKLGTIQYSTNEDLTVDGDYEYIGLRSNSGALYLSEVDITWSSGSFTTYYTSLPRVSLPYTVTFGDDNDNDDWMIDPEQQIEGGTVTVRYEGENKVKSVTVAPKGALTGKFSVSSTKQVQFSKGNLQYVGTWQFAANQYDIFGASQSDNHRDLFGWGTKTNPNNTSTTNGDYSWAEWGENTITNGCTGWRTLTKDEWGYLFTDRANASTLRTFATVNSVTGLILMPDGWTASGVTLTITTANYTTNVLSTSQWATLEKQGCVFLPAAGGRIGNGVVNVGSIGDYWSSDASDETNENAYDLNFSNNNLLPQYKGGQRHYGWSVRLVRDVE